jgi:hypothetical protein
MLYSIELRGRYLLFWMRAAKIKEKTVVAKSVQQLTAKQAVFLYGKPLNHSFH